MKINCPSYVNKALELLESNGFSAYAVGGCVRDSIMKREPNDWDMTTSALPQQTQDVFKLYRTIPTGIKHGTVTVLIERQPLEITTMRVDGEYNDNRRPETVEYTDNIELDLSRRDFTVNAIAYNHQNGIVDPFDGRGDIERRLIRCVGDPDKRFNEDALRIIRALRFASVLDFEIEERTSESILKNRHLLKNVANERIRVELLKLLMGKSAEKILLRYKDVIFDIIPELRATDGFPQQTPYHIYDVWTHTCKAVSAIENTSVLRMAALLHDVAKSECLTTDENGVAHFKGHTDVGAQKAREILRRLRFSNVDTNAVCNVVLLHERRPDGNKNHLARLCSAYSIDDVRNAIKMMLADSEAKNPEYMAGEKEKYLLALKQLDEIEEEKMCLKISELAINGNDLKALGIYGSEIKATLESLLEAVIDGKTENKKETLIECAKCMC